MNTGRKLFWIAFGIYIIVLFVYGVLSLPQMISRFSENKRLKDVDIKSEQNAIVIPKEETPINTKGQNTNEDVSSEFPSLSEEQISILITKVAEEHNKRCPFMVDKETRLDNIVVLFGRCLQYNYTIVNHKRNEINIKELKNDMISEIKNEFRTNPRLKLLRQLSVTFVYDYKDKFGNNILNFSIVPDDYNM
jgi:uncharacterized protein YbcI